MALLNINLLAQQQSKAHRLDEASVIVGVVTATLVGLQLLIFLFLVSTHAVRSAQKDSMIGDTTELVQKQSEVKKVTSGPYQPMTAAQQLKAFDAQVEAAKSLIQNHKRFSLYLSEVAVNTPPTVVMNAFSIDGTDKLLIEGTACTYTDTAALVENFKKLNFARDATLRDAKLSSQSGGTAQSCDIKDNQQGPVDFGITLLLKPVVTIGPKSPAPQASTRPSVRPTSSPRITASPR